MHSGWNGLHCLEHNWIILSTRGRRQAVALTLYKLLQCFVLNRSYNNIMI